MIKAAVKGDDGKAFILLGLSDENVRRLKNGMPIIFNAAELGLPKVDIAVFHGETEAQIVEELKEQGLITDRTVEIMDLQTKDHES